MPTLTTDPEKMMQSALELDKSSLWFQVALTHTDAKAFLGASGDGALAPLIDALVAAFPEALWWQERFLVGREYSRVIYFRLWVGQDSGEAMVRVRAIANEFEVNEVDLVRGSIRLAWD
jgi:hypothetical protein